MKNTVNSGMLKGFYRHAVQKELQRRGFPKETAKKIDAEYRKIASRAGEIGNSRLLSAYVMGIYFIAMNRVTSLSPEENYEIFKDGLMASGLFHMVMGNADAYLDPKKMPGRLAWSAETHQRKYENDWVVDILPGNDTFDLGYDYTECGVVKLCRDEGCPELAKWLCQLDFVMADMMGMRLDRTMTIAEGGDHCDFRYRKK